MSGCSSLRARTRPTGTLPKSAVPHSMRPRMRAMRRLLMKSKEWEQKDDYEL